MKVTTRKPASIARQRERTRQWQELRAVANLAAGLTTAGKPRTTQRGHALSRRTRRLLAQHQRRLHQIHRQTKLTPMEMAWQAERASMGRIEAAEIQLNAVARGHEE
jgi:hypothetical protein